MINNATENKRYSFRELLPPLSQPEKDALRASIEADGVRDPVVKDEDGNVLDGHHRLEIKPDAPVRVVPGSGQWTRARREAFVYQANYTRRNLSPEQKGEVDAKRREVAQTLYAETNGKGARIYSQEQIGAMLGATGRAVRFWLDETDESATDTERSAPGSIGSLADAPAVQPALRPRARHTKIDPDERPIIFDRWQAGDTQAQIAADYGASEVRIRQICRQEKAKREETDKNKPTHTPEMPKKVYHCIVIDPPWPMGKSERTPRPDQGRKLAYSTMSLEEIEALPVPDLIDPSGCHVYLWVTHRFLPDGLRLLEKWGFTYHCLLTWVKPTGMTPYSWMFNTEHVLFGYTAGKFKAGKKGLKVSFEASTPRGKHSTKPEVFFERVREFSAGRRIELFAREPHAGFEGWGNEFPNR